MSVWLAIPSKRPQEECAPVLRAWKERGYWVSLWRDDCSDSCFKRDGLADEVREGGIYPGYARAVNALCKDIIARDEQAEWIVAAGDDTLPDPNKTAEKIAAELSAHFAIGLQSTPVEVQPFIRGATFGVCQPTGDPWADSAGRIIERIAGSPWIGREFARRMYGGAGPYWDEYTHCFVDEELQCVAQKLGVFWQRPDLVHHHNNWARVHAGRPQDMPDFLREANSPEHWAKYSSIFKARKEAGFPGHEPIS